MNGKSCCAPAAERGEALAVAPSTATPQTFSSAGMALIPKGAFLMGSNGPEAWPADGEGPVHEVSLSAYWIDECAVTNDQFAEFADATGYLTEGERFGWSFVHYSQISKQQRKMLEAFRVAGLEWWFRVDGSDWRHPLGPKADYQELRRGDHPAVHVSWNDAAAYAKWRGKRLPTEAEWERASRGGLEQKLYPWGDELLPGGKHRCNIWQGEFPKHDRGDDGYAGTAPARSFKPNDYGLFNITGNVWEWVADWFHPASHATGPWENPVGPAYGDRKIMKGGSHLCHASYCNRYRCAARTSNTPDSSTGHMGFRCAAEA